jgi:hypothetical protein
MRVARQQPREFADPFAAEHGRIQALEGNP